jgi:Family of unknown function (DUF6152)
MKGNVSTRGRAPQMAGLAPALCLSLGLLAVLGPVPSASAHHSWARYDGDHVFTIEGTLTSVDFSNPHVIMHFTGAAEGEARTEWTMEMDPPTLLIRYGLKHDTFAAGMTIKITGVRARTGVPVMRALTIETQDGTVYRVSSRI